MEYFVMTRKGVFRADHPTPNQCKEKGHVEYEYQLKMVFPSTVQLDGNSFIVDHIELDKLVQELALAGSCETMQVRLCHKVRSFFISRGIELKACRSTIKPVTANGLAWMDYIYTSDSLNPVYVAALA